MRPVKEFDWFVEPDPENVLSPLEPSSAEFPREFGNMLPITVGSVTEFSLVLEVAAFCDFVA